MINNLAIDQETGDLLEAANQIQQVTELDAVSQAVYSDLKTFLGEYWLNKTIGVPYYEVVFKKGVDLSIIKTLLKNEILKRDDVTEILSFTAEFIGTGRELKVVFSARTTYGTIEDQEIVL